MTLISNFGFACTATPYCLLNIYFVVKILLQITQFSHLNFIPYLKLVCLFRHLSTNISAYLGTHSSRVMTHFQNSSKILSYSDEFGKILKVTWINFENFFRNNVNKIRKMRFDTPTLDKTLALQVSYQYQLLKLFTCTNINHHHHLVPEYRRTNLEEVVLLADLTNFDINFQNINNKPIYRASSKR
uniref:Uncharacterized protein n=1 Tax=Glossina brevipalpis TaxID=37001 RepID=A0A1A9WTS3_9MUSC